MAKCEVADLVGATAPEIIFMCNGTETINHCLLGMYELRKAEGRRGVVTQATEHVAVLETCKMLKELGAEVTKE